MLDSELAQTVVVETHCERCCPHEPPEQRGYQSTLTQAFRGVPAVALLFKMCRLGNDGLAKYVKRVPEHLRAPCGAHPACWAVECECGQVVHAGQYPVECQCGVWLVGDRLAVYAIRLPETPDGE